MASLASLPIGRRGSSSRAPTRRSSFERVQVRERRTFNSSATPKAGEQRVEPSVFADVDLDALREQMAETIERGSSLPAGEAKILAAIAQHPQGCTREQLLVLTGYKRSSRNTFLQHLQQKGLITRQGERFHATDEGWAVLGDDFERLPTGEELLAHWLSEGELPEGERRILVELSEVFPDGYERAELIEVTGYKRSSVNTFVQHLRARELVTVDGSAVFASGDLFG
jgi:DNA-binding MarR family transcriptional regulator